MSDDPFTPAELNAAAEELDRQSGNDDDRSVAAYILRAVLPRHATRVRADERNRIDAALRAMPCPEPERPGAGIVADRHYAWMTEVLRIVHATAPTVGDPDA